ncbi:16307_t:CDS:2, partial [Rhizophagus irregularis]
MTNPKILAENYKKILTILNNITKNEDNTPLIDYPVLIGSRAVKWHISFCREPNDWDMVATPLQTTLFINKVKESGATFKNMKLIHYPGGGLKLVGEYIDQHTDKKLISFDIELVSEKVDLRNMKSNMNLNKKESDEDESDEDESDEDDNISEDNSDISNDSEDFEYSEDNMEDDDMQDDDEINKIEFERFNDVHPKLSALMILELCSLKTSHIYWPADFHKNISDLHLLRILLGYNKIPTIQPLCSPQRDESIELMLKTRIKETEIIRGIP